MPAAPAIKRPFAEVYEDHFSYVYNLLYMQVLHRQQAEDLTSDTFYKALSAYDRFDPAMASERTWLARIAQRLLIDHYRSRASNKVDAVTDEVLGTIPYTEQAYEQITDTTTQAVQLLLASLDEEERQILIMRYFMDMKNPAIAEFLHITPKAVSERFRRVLPKCQKQMEKLHLTEYL